ncbi:hypothetical protein BH10ACI1_BH10ACI1_28610 [soil metagenome]
MKKAEQAERLKEMKRLYDVEGWTLQQIGDKFGLTRQAVQNRFSRAGFRQRPRKPPSKTFDREILVRLYIDEMLTLGETAKYLKSTYNTVKREMKKNGIELREHGFSQRKYREIEKLEIGESIEIIFPESNVPYSSFHGKAKKLGIKISVKQLNEVTFQIYRKA